MEEKIKPLIAELEERQNYYSERKKDFGKSNDTVNKSILSGKIIESGFVIERLNNILKGE